MALVVMDRNRLLVAGIGRRRRFVAFYICLNRCT
jgi:hypothetical protein